MLIKCKMCGFDIEVNEGQSICECEVCHSKQTIPTLDSDNKIGYFNRANLQRIRCEFDKAIEEYNLLIERFPNDPEAYWGKCLASYGIEYVDDPKTNKKIPTCHRTKEESILINKDYLKVLENCNEESKAFYEKEAKEIDRLQKEIISLSSKEELYDIFICYKETDNNGDRTIDSVIAQEIYDKLIEKGYKVFFARRTLEKKLGLEYEPIIFAALRSAKAMLVIGTSVENFNGIWVKNEWSRYLEMMKKDSSKNLIPCYKNIDPYDMPLEFVPLQSQDLSKVGYMQDLIYGIDKILNSKKVEIKEDKSLDNSYVDKLLERCKLLLETNQPKKATPLLEEVLSNDPNNFSAYLLKLLIELGLQKEEDLKNNSNDLYSYGSFLIAEKVANKLEKKKLDYYVECSKKNALTDKNQSVYDSAISLISQGKYSLAIEQFKSILNFKDAKEQIEICNDKIKDEIYKRALNKIKNHKYEEAINIFKSILDYKDSKTQIELCNSLIKEEIYNKGKLLIDQGKYYDAISLYKSILKYKDSKKIIDFCKKKISKIVPKKYRKAKSFIRKRDYLSAIKIFQSIVDYKDSKQKVEKCNEILYKKAENYIKKYKYGKALIILENIIDYNDSSQRIHNVKSLVEIDSQYKHAISLTKNKHYNEENLNKAKSIFLNLDYRDSAKRAKKCEEKIKTHTNGWYILFLILLAIIFLIPFINFIITLKN